MKRILCLLLAFCLMLFCVACTVEETESISTPSAETSSVETSSTVSEESKEETVFVQNELIAEIDAFLTGEVPDRTMKAKNLFRQASYSYNIEPESSYPDSNRTKLKDGIRQNMFDSTHWVAFKGSTVPVVTFDLKGSNFQLADIEIDMVRQTDYGIELPSDVILSVSEDGENFTTISTLTSPDDVGEGAVFVYRFALPKTISTRYVRMSFLRQTDGFLFIDEITGYEYCEDGTLDPSSTNSADDANLLNDYYQYDLKTEITTPVSDSDADYNTHQNLALLSGANVQATHFDPLDPAHVSGNSTIQQLAGLIDGKKATLAGYSDPAFLKFSRAKGRHIVVDLGNEMAVDEVCVDFLNQVNAGVGAPPAIMISVSSDGESWITTYGDYTVPYGDNTIQIVKIKAAFKQICRARYVRVSFCTVPDNTVSSNVYISEIEVWGKKNTQGISEPKDDPSIVLGRFPDVEDIGAENIYLAAINGNSNAGSDGNLTLEGALKHLAYLDQDGKITDSFFDSVLFCPSMRFHFGEDIKENADRCRADFFAKGLNVDAWNTATAMVQEAIPGTPNSTVWLNLMCPETTEYCSDVDGDGKAENLTTADGWYAYLKYQVDEYLKVWEQAGFEHTELLGFYWNNESLYRETLALEKESIKKISAYIHSLGYKIFWCPYNTAYGIWMWEEVGFDFACLQPNYMFRVTETTRMQNTADIAQLYGMCVELEIEIVISEGTVGKYREYLRQGYDSGYMSSVKLYYVGGIPSAMESAYDIGSPLSLSVYEDTYKFAKRRLDETYNVESASGVDQFEDLSLEIAHGTRVSFNLGDTQEYSVRIIESTVYGKFQLNLGGSGNYHAMENFLGEDRVVLEISDAAGNKKNITISITVTEE